MNKFQELRCSVEALNDAAAIKKNEEFFSPISAYVQKMYKSLVSQADSAKKDELKFFAQKIEDHFEKYRPSSDSIYIPPRAASLNDSTVKEIYRLASELDSLSLQEFDDLKTKSDNIIDSLQDKTSKNNFEFHLDLLLTKFHFVAKQLQYRHDKRNVLTINDEYDVQYLLHALLKIYFEDVRPEENTPTYGGSSSRVDFLLKKNKIVVEVKMASKTLGDKLIGEQLIIDIKKYQSHPDCKSLYCLVYDPNSCIKNPNALETDLSSKHDDLFVKVYVVPH